MVLSQTRATNVFDLLSPRVQELISEFGLREPTPPQIEAIPTVQLGSDALLIAPTGSGKTEAVLLPILDALAKGERVRGIRLVYITPLRALNRDMLRRLLMWCQKLGLTVEIRHGDTPQKLRRRQAAQPPDILITTPESLQAILVSKPMQENLRHVGWVVIDELHQIASNRRGVQLAVALERLDRAVNRHVQRVGLSATIGSTEIAAKLLSGRHNAKILDVETKKTIRYLIEFPQPLEEDHEHARELYTSPEAAGRLRRLAELIDSHVSTLVFVNSRTNAELLGSRLKMLGANVAVHHGSLPREERESVETDFKGGKVRGLVCTSTMELGIDIGSVDLVAQYMSPRQVNSLIQRVGRSGHDLRRTSEGIMISTFTDDLVECLATVRLASRKRLEPLIVHENSLDVLAHQIVGCCLDRGGETEKQYVMETVTASYPYRGLTEEIFEKVSIFLVKLGYLRIDSNKISVTEKGRIYYLQNLSMIPDEKRYPVVDLTTQQKVGILGDEFMALKARPGLRFIVKGLIWEIQQIGGDGTVFVMPIEDPTAAIPGWDGELIPVPREVAQEVGKLRKFSGDLIKGKGLDHAIKRTRDSWPLESYGRRRFLEEIYEHLQASVPLPTDDIIVIEAFENYLIVHSCFGDRINNTLGEVFEELLSRQGLVRFWWNDGYRVLIELSVNSRELSLESIIKSLLKIDEQVLTGAFNAVLHRHAAFAYYMKFVAERFGVLPRGKFVYGNSVKELWTRMRYTPVYDETIREALLLRVDEQGIRGIYHSIKEGRITVKAHRSDIKPSPIAFHILNRHVQQPELIAPEGATRDAVERMKLGILSRTTDLLCFKCGNLQNGVKIGELPDQPRCPRCEFGLLAPISWMAPVSRVILEKKLRSQMLDPEEEKLLVRGRRAADLVLSYGKRAVIALMVYGVGPQTASKILAKMHSDEGQFYGDLLEAKKQFITTRPYWS